ncbi:DNA-binding SARP family transcriptional activator [Saccharothrix ecbatanensis]|uniref:DNA-binding SARP family transcriptional activator n=1 Tax=Saccharothrix ecbatanensis TaxID=1105145 RepID=A0A7W9M3L8_9PSEU|nr:BTAD domain-containing putative transcriptional regulator [Saccharothrix ecbatanensis]MBB5806171.1 DNA-binding SARP family transcriptional activator [Saccharothrix ecbatanensis]
MATRFTAPGLVAPPAQPSPSSTAVPASTGTRFNVLGPLEVWHDGERLTIPAGRARVLLATLLLRANQPVPVGTLVDRLWEDGAPNPDRAKATLQMVVRRLRQALGDANVVRTVTHGYVADVDPESFDLHRFRRLAANGEYAEALALWRGEPLSDVRSDVLHTAEVEPLLEERLVVLERRIEVDLTAGRFGGLVPQLRSLTRAYPLRERFWGQLVLALHGSDQQAEALAAFSAVRKLLAEELGVDPSEYLRAVHRTVLVGGAEPTPRLKPWTALCQLPPDTADFIGRDDVCTEASALLTANPSRTAVPVVAITGAPGTGKSTLTIRIAHELRADFPDGQLFVRLDGAGAAPRDPAEVLAELLTAVGLNPAAMPDRLETRAAAFRSRIADRAVLLVLDDAAGFDQVRHLMPGTASSAVLISSRHRLGGLPGIRPLQVHPLAAASGLALLSRMIGERRTAAEAPAAAAIVEACGGLPLALRIVGARLAARRSLPLAKLADRLADERRRLDELATGDLEVRASLELSYEALPPDAALAFRRLGLLGATDVASWVVKALTGLDDQEQAVEQLVEANLLEDVGCDATGEPRYRLHDILAVYAAELAGDDDGSTAALRDYIDTLTTLVDAALHWVPSSVDELPPDPIEPSRLLPAPEIARLTEAGTSWLVAEQTQLVHAVEMAARRGWAGPVVALIERMMTHLDVYIPFDRVVELYQVARDTADVVGERRLWWRMELSIQSQLAKRVLDDSLVESIANCAEGFREIGDLPGEAIALATVVHYDYLHTGKADVDLARRAVDVARRSGLKEIYCSALRELASMLAASGRYAESLPCFEETLALTREFGDPLPEVGVLYRIARYALDHDDLDRALEVSDRALELLSGFEDMRAVAYMSSLAATVKLAVGAATEALPLAERAYRVFGEIGEDIGTPGAVAAIAEAHLALGRPEEALRVLEPALAEYRDVGAAQSVERMEQAFGRATAAIARPADRSPGP